MGFANEKGWNKQIFLGYFSNGEGVDFVDTLSFVSARYTNAV